MVLDLNEMALAAVLIAGSAARGYADRCSDVELMMAGASLQRQIVGRRGEQREGPTLP